MRRGFTMIEMLTVVALVIVIAAAMTRSVSQARTRAWLAKAQSEMTSIVAEVGAAKDPDAAASRYSDGQVRDPWGNSYKVELKRTIVEGESSVAGGSVTVWYPNAYSPRRTYR